MPFDEVPELKANSGKQGHLHMDGPTPGLGRAYSPGSGICAPSAEDLEREDVGLPSPAWVQRSPSLALPFGPFLQHSKTLSVFRFLALGLQAHTRNGWIDNPREADSRRPEDSMTPQEKPVPLTPPMQEPPVLIPGPGPEVPSTPFEVKEPLRSTGSQSEEAHGWGVDQPDRRGASRTT